MLIKPQRLGFDPAEAWRFALLAALGHQLHSETHAKGRNFLHENLLIEDRDHAGFMQFLHAGVKRAHSGHNDPGCVLQVASRRRDPGSGADFPEHVLHRPEIAGPVIDNRDHLVFPASADRLSASTARMFSIWLRRKYRSEVSSETAPQPRSFTRAAKDAGLSIRTASPRSARSRTSSCPGNARIPVGVPMPRASKWHAEERLRCRSDIAIISNVSGFELPGHIVTRSSCLNVAS